MTEALIFNTAPKTSQVPDIPFTLDEREYIAHAPKKAAWGILMHGLTNPGRADGLQSAMTFLDACLDLPDQMHIEQRLRSRDDDLDIDDLLEVVQALVEEWEPYLGEEFAELSGENRTNRRAAARRSGRQQPARRTAANAARQPARRTNANGPQAGDEATK
ncbi:hypothetical protein ACIRLA_46415 [Streptomyces sp. NPDC102364]|uniref:hypothetical protein n=1 Tax=Streptomyces sp. NPDC102364 TaxID=3366161 RepID=UPI0037FBDBB0